jgi:anti-sigma B factor antagonist
MSLKIKVKKHNAIPVFQIEGEAVGQDVADISKKVEPYLKSEEPLIAIDLSGTSIIDSYGLGVLVFLWKQFGSQNRQLVFVNPQDFLRNLFEGTNLAKVFKIVESVEKL